MQRARVRAGQIFQGRRQRGVALVLVLWVLVLLALIAAAFLSETRSGMVAATHRQGAARAEALADGGVHWALWRLLSADVPRGGTPTLPLDGRPVTRDLDGGRVAVRVRDVYGRIDLNVAEARTLARLLVAVGVPDSRARTLTARIQDYREPAGRGAGGPDGAYARAGLAYGPKGGRFATPAELAMVPGISADLTARLRPHLTVLSGTRALDPQAATALALHANGEVGREAAADYVARRAAAPFDAPPAPPNGGRFLTSPRHSFTITARAQAPGGGVFTRTATVRLDPVQGDAPYRILDWRQAVPLRAPER